MGEVSDAVVPAVTASGKKIGRPKGTFTEAERERVRTQNYRHGRRAGVITAERAQRARLRKLDPEAPELIEAMVKAAGGGDLDVPTRIAATAMIETEILRRRAVDAVKEDGIRVEDEMFDRDGKVYGTRKKAHPLLEHIHRFNEDVGATAEQMQVTKKSKGEGARDDAITRMLEHDAQLRSADKSRFPMPGPAIDITPVK